MGFCCNKNDWWKRIALEMNFLIHILPSDFSEEEEEEEEEE